jgi:hypothetical protein
MADRGWEELHKAVAELWGYDQGWPTHGNAPLAIAAGVALRESEVGRLRAWVDDLQSGMYVNCVYCGHRYGPNETTPVSMADALKAHIEECPDHPMSALREEVQRLRAALALPRLGAALARPAEPVGEWRPIETAPRDGTEVLTLRRAGLMSVAAYLPHGKAEWCCADGGRLLNVTHWMPLPDPPEVPHG